MNRADTNPNTPHSSENHVPTKNTTAHRRFMPRPSHIRPDAATKFPTGTCTATTTQVMSEMTKAGQSPANSLPYAPMMYLPNSEPMMTKGSVTTAVTLIEATTTFAELVLSCTPMRSERIGRTD